MQASVIPSSSATRSHTTVLLGLYPAAVRILQCSLGWCSDPYFWKVGKVAVAGGPSTFFEPQSLQFGIAKDSQSAYVGSVTSFSWSDAHVAVIQWTWTASVVVCVP